MHLAATRQIDDCGTWPGSPSRAVAHGAGFSDTLNRAAYTLGGLIAADRLSRQDAEQALKDTAAAARPGQERIEQIIRSGLAAGLKRPLHATGRRP